MHILIVEDQPQMRSMLRQFLQLSYPAATIHEAADGARAAELCRSRAPGLVLTDVGLPDINGIELVALIKALLPKSAVIVVSQHASRTHAERALAAGAAAYVTKNVMYRELLPAVAAALRGSAEGSDA